MKSNILLSLMLLVAGVVNAASTQVEDRIAHATSLNAMVAMVMNWYGSLINTNQLIVFDRSQSTWNDYRALYPHAISHIEVMSTDLIKLNDDHEYQFTSQILIFYHDNEGVQQRQKLSERFIFYVPLLAKPTIKAISRDVLDDPVSTPEPRFDSAYFKARQFSYAWLAYLDGVSSMTQMINGDNWLNTARYSLKIGSLETTDKIASTLLKRNHYLATGGHLLRSIDVQQHADDTDRIMLTLIIEWQGENAGGQPVIAKIHQEIDIKISENNDWEVLAINEHHLLPDLKPWQGFLC
ncbi:MAG: hypothetical protein P1P93_09290 [Gammaproteobacteria bacterium]|nr:hypothetical protein [Gammaproteobacteria bacterium]